MDADWDEVARFQPPPPGKHGAPTAVTALAFDTQQDLLWTGNEYGRVASFSFSGTTCERYTSFRAQCTKVGPNQHQLCDQVRQILFCDKGVIALCPKSIHLASRKAVPIWHIQHEDMKDLHCMSFTSRGTSEIVVAGRQGVMLVIDVNKGEVTKQIPSKDQYRRMRRGRYICAEVLNTITGASTGTINLLESTTLKVVKSWPAHSGGISDFDTQQDFIVCCGYTLKQGSDWMHAHFVSVFDVKNLVSLAPIPFPPGAAFVRMHPLLSTTAIVVSQLGQIQFIDLLNANLAASTIRQANITSFLKMIEIAPAGRTLVLATEQPDYLIQVWGSSRSTGFSDMGIPIERADYPPPPTQLDWSVETPLNTIGMPYYRDTLLSAWPSHMVSEVGAPPPQIDPLTLANLTRDGYLLKGQNVRRLKRNQYENTRQIKDRLSSIQPPKFLSEKARDGARDVERRISDVAETLGGADFNLKAEVPIVYRNVEIRYSKFGVDDFDFGFYNKTTYSGLETHISNSYANSLLQVLKYTPLFRNMALRHAAYACKNDECLLCEMAYLFDMLEKAEGSVCQATNLLKALNSDADAASLQLLEDHNSSNSSLTNMLQGLNRWLMRKLSVDSKATAPYVGFDELVYTESNNTIQCMACKWKHGRPGTTFVNELHYPSLKVNSRNVRSPKVTFSQILKASIEGESMSKGWCKKCQRYQNVQTKKSVSRIPSLLMLNAAINTPDARLLWGTPGWLPEEIGIIVDNQGQLFCYEGDEIRMHVQRGIHNIEIYSLVGFVAEIDSGQNQKPHLVSLINVAHSQRTASTASNWHLFNDFLVRPMRREDALNFSTTWKLPSIIAYQLKKGNNHIDDSWKDNLDTSLLHTDNARLPAVPTYVPLDANTETPTKGSIIALDTEFVSIRQQEIEMSVSGERITSRPIVYALARVSVIRGPSASFSTELELGTPFIDDYVRNDGPIVDYLTSYSGIEAGDLDPAVSKHHLVPLKTAYRKLWILLNLGCIFLGHGLKQDFRVANIHVPKSQVIDTAECYYLQERLRKLSLAFLAWSVLREEIQTGNHDSIEDARTALKLYMKYQEWTDAGIMEAMLREIYAKGRETGYKPPGKAGRASVEDGSEYGTPKKSNTSVA